MADAIRRIIPAGGCRVLTARADGHARCAVPIRSASPVAAAPFTRESGGRGWL